MQAGILLALAAYLSYALADAVFKALGPHLSVFEIGLFTALFAFLPIVFTKRADDGWRNVFVPTRPDLLFVHMVAGASCSILAVAAFTNLPLAEAYALIFLLPLIVTALSALVLKEPIGLLRWAAVIAGLLGVLVVVRPGFQILGIGHLAALGTAFFGAIQVLVLRAIGRSERRITILGALLVATVLANGVALLFTGLSVPAANLWVLIAAGGILMGLGHTGLVFATRVASAATIAPTHYSQILWAVVLGLVFFAEVPDVFTLLGMAIVAGSGLFTFRRERRNAHRSRRTPSLQDP